MKIPFFNLSRQNALRKEEILNAFSEVLDNGDFIEGKAVRELEQQMQNYLNVKHVITCGNGTEALMIALAAAGVKQGDEVITTPFSFFATAEAISLLKAVPVFAEIDRITLNIDPMRIEEKITDKTKAILPVHIFGAAAKMDEVNAIAQRHGLKVIEDACQAIGASYKGKKVGGLGDAAAFSFYPTKNLGACGDGGMITTNDDEIATVCRALKAHGAGRMGAEAAAILENREIEQFDPSVSAGDSLYDPYKYYNFLTGGNSRLDTLQAASLLVKMKHLDEYNNNRLKIAEQYCEGLKELPIQLPVFDTECCYHQFAVMVLQKDHFVEYLAEQGIGTGAFYPVPLHLQKAFRELGGTEGDLPVAEEICHQSVCLPIFPELMQEEVDHIIDSVKRYFA